MPGQPPTKPKPSSVEPESVTDEEKLKRLISITFGIDENDILNNARFIHDLEMDSLDLIELSMVVEEEFAFEFDEEYDTCKLTTLGKWLDAIQKRGKE